MRAVTVVLALLLLDVPARADTVVLVGGKKLDGVVVKEGTADGDPVVVNPYNSRCPDMTYGITEKEKYPRSKVAEVKVADPPLVEYRERASRPGVTPEEHLALAKF